MIDRIRLAMGRPGILRCLGLRSYPVACHPPRIVPIEREMRKIVFHLNGLTSALSDGPEYDRRALSAIICRRDPAMQRAPAAP
jgi:hypothetical protein